MEISEPWRIFETIEWRREVQSRGLFGGEALLYCVLEGVDAEFLVAHFRIGGENPTNELARSVVEQFIPGADPAGDLWFSYAIAKHETAEYRYTPPGASQPSYYNQFRSNPRKFDFGYPAWNDDGKKVPGGYGIFQVTGNVALAEANIPRNQIWNWMLNVVAGGKIIRSKSTNAVSWLRKYREMASQNPIPDLRVNGVLFSEDVAETGFRRTILDAMILKGYNGLSKLNLNLENDWEEIPGFLVRDPIRGNFCYWDPQARGWHLSRFNWPHDYPRIKPFNYVHLVCGQMEETKGSASR
jgi:hypothetical protein